MRCECERRRGLSSTERESERRKKKKKDKTPGQFSRGYETDEVLSLFLPPSTSPHSFPHSLTLLLARSRYAFLSISHSISHSIFFPLSFTLIFSVILYRVPICTGLRPSLPLFKLRDSYGVMFCVRLWHRCENVY